MVVVHIRLVPVVAKLSGRAGISSQVFKEDKNCTTRVLGASGARGSTRIPTQCVPPADNECQEKQHYLSALKHTKAENSAGCWKLGFPHKQTTLFDTSSYRAFSGILSILSILRIVLLRDAEILYAECP